MRWLILLALLTMPTLVLTPVSVQSCTGHADTSPGCPADPKPWVCTREGKAGAKACACKQVCEGDEQAAEGVDCARWCESKKCLCHVEEECPRP